MAKGKKNPGETENNNNDNNNNNKNNNGGSFMDVILKVDLHCDGCCKRIKKNILKFPGVCKVETEGESKVKIMAQKNVDVVKLRDKLQKKMMKRFELVSPQPPKKDDNKVKNKDTKEKPNEKEVPVTTVVLKVQYHCHGCVERIHKAFNAYKGVHEVKLDQEKGTVKVTGRIEVKKMIEDVSKKLHRPIEIVPEKKDKDKENNQGKNGGGGGGDGKKDNNNVKVEYLVNGSDYLGMYDGSGWVIQIFDTPQYFSDDNPNACSIM